MARKKKADEPADALAIIGEALAPVLGPRPEPAPEPSVAERHLAKITALNDTITVLEVDFHAKDREAKKSKKALESAQTDLNAYIRGVNERLPLFDNPEPAELEPAELEPAADLSRARIVDIPGIDAATTVALSEANILQAGYMAEKFATLGSDERIAEFLDIMPEQAADARAALQAFLDPNRPAEPDAAFAARMDAQSEAPATEAPKRGRKPKAATT